MASDEMPGAAFTHTVRGFFGEELTIVAYAPEDGEDPGAVEFVIRGEQGGAALSAHISSPAEREALARALMEAYRIADGETGATEARPAACGLCKDGLVEAKGCNCGSPADEAAGFRHENLCGFEPCPNGCWGRLHPDTAPEWLCAVPADCANGPGPHAFTPVAGDPLARPCSRQPQETAVVPAVLAAAEDGEASRG